MSVNVVTPIGLGACSECQTGNIDVYRGPSEEEKAVDKEVYQGMVDELGKPAADKAQAEAMVLLSQILESDPSARFRLVEHKFHGERCDGSHQIPETVYKPQ